MLKGLQKLGKALMLPVAVLPAAALLLRLGADDVLNIPFVMQAGAAIFDNLALLFAVGIAVGVAFDGGGAAALAGAVGYFTLTKAVVTINPAINMGVLAGIVSGVTAGMLYNKYHDARLPDVLGFFGGKRFVPIATSIASIVLALVFGYAWPPVQDAIHGVGEWLLGAGLTGAFTFGTLNRLLLPLGLHHVLNSMVWFVFGEFTNAAGAVVTGDLHRFFAGDPTAGVFMTGFFPIMMFALPAAALAMYTTARDENKKAVSGILLSVAVIKGMNLMTPGREEEAGGATASAVSKSDLEKLALDYLATLGGADNIEDIGACITRLRLVVRNGKLVEEARIKALGATGLVRPNSTTLQVVIGTKAELLADVMKKHMKK